MRVGKFLPSRCSSSLYSIPLTESCWEIPMDLDSVELHPPGGRKFVEKFRRRHMLIEIFRPNHRNLSEYLALHVKKMFRPPDTWVLRHPVTQADFSVNSFYSVHIPHTFHKKCNTRFCLLLFGKLWGHRFKNFNHWWSHVKTINIPVQFGFLLADHRFSGIDLSELFSGPLTLGVYST
jgi:hypothetical protein